MNLQFSARAGRGEILLYGDIGSAGDITATDFDSKLKALGKLSDLDIRINSPGGETTTAASIFNMLARAKAAGTHITVTIDGLAASAASWIAMVGHEVVMPANALMMIHDPSGLVAGGATDMRGLADVLDKIKSAMVSAYVAKSGKSKDEVGAIMSAETWYSAEEAVAAGFADRVVDAVQIAARFDPAKYAHKPVPESLVAESLDANRIWRNHRAGRPTWTSASTLHQQPLTRDEIARRLGGAS